ncbi:MAG: PfkB family carbohydrate kinase, partial [Clostridia bacterium]|nr:PfkB family carbohydrate kinase [Clostridia bacterium]
NTTLAIVSLKDGERDFAFFRHDTADFNISSNRIDLNRYNGLNIVHLGSLMLSEEKGQEFAKDIVKKVRKANKILSFDVNFRMDLYKSLEDAIKAYKPFIDEADILKFSDDEILDYTGEKTLEDAIKRVYKKDRLLLITLGSKGSMYIYNDLRGTIPTEKVKPIDTTGAGDAFFGTVLAYLDGKEFTKGNIETALVEGNKKGARATQFKGAVKL